MRNTPAKQAATYSPVPAPASSAGCTPHASQSCASANSKENDTNARNFACSSCSCLSPYMTSSSGQARVSRRASWLRCRASRNSGWVSYSSRPSVVACAAPRRLPGKTNASLGGRPFVSPIRNSDCGDSEGERSFPSEAPRLTRRSPPACDWRPIPASRGPPASPSRSRSSVNEPATIVNRWLN